MHVIVEDSARNNLEDIYYYNFQYSLKNAIETDINIYELIEILEKAGCSEKQIKNIFLCNPFYLTRKVFDVLNMIQKLYEIGCSHLNLLFDSNPYILNLMDEEIEAFVNKKIHEGHSKEEILDILQYEVIF